MPRLPYHQLIFAGAGPLDRVNPLVDVLLVASLTLWIVGYARLGSARRAVAPPVRVGAYWLAVASLLTVLRSPVEGWTDTSFAWHMAQHMTLMMVAAPLLAISNLHLVALLAFPISWRRGIGRAVARFPGVRAGGSSRLAPVLAAAAVVLGLWLWHAPALYEATFESRLLHDLEHLTFLFTSILFWRMLVTAGDRRLDLGTSVRLVAVMGLQGNLLAVLILLAPEPLYAAYAAQGGLTDQQIAAAVMLVPAGLIYLAGTVWALWKLMRVQAPGASGPT